MATETELPKIGKNYRITEDWKLSDDLGLGNFSRRLSQKVVFTLNSEVFILSKWRRYSPKVVFTIQGEDDFLRKSSSLFKITETELPRLELPIFGGFLPNYRDRDRSFEITETDYRAHMLATVPTLGEIAKSLKKIWISSC